MSYQLPVWADLLLLLSHYCAAVALSRPLLLRLLWFSSAVSLGELHLLRFTIGVSAALFHSPSGSCRNVLVWHDHDTVTKEASILRQGAAAR
jgi:hypothetical protein